MYSIMLTFNCWILSALLLGHLIAGVNRDVFNIGVASSFNDAVLSREVRKIVHFHHKITQIDKLNNDNNDNILLASSKQARPITNASNLTLCSPHDSCVNRCGKIPKELPFTCNCDSLCTTFSDCCVDYNEHCGLENNTSNYENQLLSIPRLRCEILFMKYNVLTVNTCPKEYHGSFNAKMCFSEIPKDCVFRDDLNVSGAEQVYLKCKKSVHRNCMSQFNSRCDIKVEPLCNVINKECDKRATRTCRQCESSFWPVLGKDGVIYRNSYCALCNSQKSDIILSPSVLKSKMKEINEFNLTDKYSMYFSRHCIPVNVDSCPKKGVNEEMQKMCSNHTGVVTRGKGGLTYKNYHCAICNGEELKNLRCATRASLISRLITPMLETFISGDVEGMRFDDIPAAFSILLNFGLDGRERMYFSSEGEEEMKRYQQKCGQGRIWDPFSEVCRKLYCSTEFVLVDYRCVRKEATTEEEPAYEHETPIVPNARAEFVHLTLSVKMEMLDFLQFHGQDIDAICETARESLSNSFNVNIERIRDVRFNITVGDFGDLDEMLLFIEDMDDLHPIKFKLEFDLYEDFSVNITVSEPSVDSIVSMLASSLSMDGFELDINNVTSRIFEIHQTVSPLTTWCKTEDGGVKQEYWNSEFSLKLNDNSTVRDNQIKGIFVNKTGRFYSQGKFIADILFQGYQFSGGLINVSGVAVVCDWKNKLNESCIRILIDPEEYSILENGKLSIQNENLRNVVNDSSYEVAENNSLWVCIKSLKTNGNYNTYNIEVYLEQAIVSYVLLWISVIAMSVVLITYTCFESLRNLPGCNTMNLTFSLMSMQLTFLFGQRDTNTGTSCIIVGHLLHYEILCCFMWMNVMAFDLFRTFGNRNVLSNIRSKRKYLPRYVIYAYLSPISIVAIASLLDYLVNESSFAPNYGKNNSCWITNQYSAIVFFAVPLAVIMCINFVFFLMTIFAMRSVKSLSQMKDLQVNRNGKSDLILYARMALVIGLTWVLSFSAASVRQSELLGQILTYLFIIFNTLQGVFVFWVFVCNKRVYQLYRGAIGNLMSTLFKQMKYESTPNTISRFADVIKRSISTNTVVSTISNASVSSNNSLPSKES